MKNLLVALLLILSFGITNAQTFQKGNIIGSHVLNIELKIGITMNQFQDFYMNTIAPEFSRSRPGWTIFLVKGINGENKNNLGVMVVIDSEESFHKYFNEDNTPSELAKAANRKLIQVYDDLHEFVVSYDTKFTDWIVL